MLNNSAIENDGLVKIYSIKNRALTTLGIFFSLFLIYYLATVPPFSSFYPAGHLSSTRLIFIGIGILSAFLVLGISSLPNVILSEKQIKIGWKFGGKFGLSHRHYISWDKITQVDSGGSRMIQWSPVTLIIYHTGKIPVGHSSDLKEAVISTALGFNNYCKILSLVVERAPKARIDHLTLHLIKQCRKGK